MIACRPFGRTGHHSSRIIFGAAALASTRQEKADEVLGLLRAYGVNHIDTAADYGDSELRLAPWLAPSDHGFFVATKTSARSGPEARRSLERSLTRLGVTRVDMIQLHNLVEPDEWKTAMGPGGALEALAQARDEGLVNYLGVTGHGLRIASMHRRSLERFDFDSVLLPYNLTLIEWPEYRSEVEALLETCLARGVAVQTIKSVARRRWPKDHSGPRFSWYEPLPAGATLQRAVHLVLQRDALFLNTSSDLRLLEPILDAAEAPPDDMDPSTLREELEALAASALFDGAAGERI
ncbi:MAG: aldo/keto reductase [Acidimicrobiales bacterium]